VLFRSPKYEADGQTRETQAYHSLGVMKSEAHDEVVRMLSFNDGLSISRLSRLEEQRIAFSGDSGGFKAEHEVRLEGPSRSDTRPRP